MERDKVTCQKSQTAIRVVKELVGEGDGNNLSDDNLRRKFWMILELICIDTLMVISFQQSRDRTSTSKQTIPLSSIRTKQKED
jgi:hypothetical protein